MIMKDLVDVLFQNIECQDLVAVKQILDHVYSLQRSSEKNKILEEVLRKSIEYFAKCILSRNSWCLEKMCTCISRCENQRRRHMFTHLFTFLCSMEKLDLSPLEECSRVDSKKVIDLVYSLNYEHKELMSLKAIIDDRVFALMNVMYGNFLHSSNLKHTLMLARYICEKKPKDIFIKNTAQSKQHDMTDGFDLLFLLIFLYIDNTHVCETDYGKFIMSCKDLFYFRCKKSDRGLRKNILLHVVLVALTKKIDYKEVVFDNDEDIEIDKMKCIFLITHYDPKRCSEVKLDRERYHKRLLEHAQTKDVLVNGLPIMGASEKYTILRQKI